MSRVQPHTPGRSLQVLLEGGTLGGLDDGRLLELFRDGSESVSDEAFGQIVDRHGPLVLGVSRSMLRNRCDVEDAFQATFLVLVQRAGSIRRTESLGPWLHGVALRLVRRARGRALKRATREAPLPPDSALTSPEPDGAQREAAALIHQEIDRMPEKLRAPLVLCELEELSYDQAARHLGIPEPTLRGRLHRGRQRLKARLVTRGLAPDRASTDDRHHGFPPIVPPWLSAATVDLARHWTAVESVAGWGVPTSVSSLVQGVLFDMTMTSIKILVVPVLLASAFIGAAVLAQQAPRPSAPVPPSAGDRASDLPPGQQAAAPQSPLATLELAQDRVRRLMAGKNTLKLEKGATLETLLKAIRVETIKEDGKGVPIYVDPLGLQEANRTLQSSIIGPWPEGGGLDLALQEALRSIGLDYVIHAGLLDVTSRQTATEHRLRALEAKLDRVLDLLSSSPRP